MHGILFQNNVYSNEDCVDTTKTAVLASGQRLAWLKELWYEGFGSMQTRFAQVLYLLLQEFFDFERYMKLLSFPHELPANARPTKNLCRNRPDAASISLLPPLLTLL